MFGATAGHRTAAIGAQEQARAIAIAVREVSQADLFLENPARRP